MKRSERLSVSAAIERGFVVVCFCLIGLICSHAQQTKTAEEHSARAHELSANGDVAGAIAELKEAIRLTPDSVEALNSLARLYVTASDETLLNPPLALRYASRAVELGQGKNPDHLDTLAKAYDANGDHENAALTEQKAITLLPEDSARRHDFQVSLGWYEQALIPNDTAAFVAYCFDHLNTCRLAVVDINNINMIQQIGGNHGCTIPRPSASGREASLASSKEATLAILAWLKTNSATAAPTKDAAIEQAIATLWPSQCEH